MATLNLDSATMKQAMSAGFKNFKASKNQNYTSTGDLTDWAPHDLTADLAAAKSSPTVGKSHPSDGVVPRWGSEHSSNQSPITPPDIQNIDNKKFTNAAETKEVGSEMYPTGAIAITPPPLHTSSTPKPKSYRDAVAAKVDEPVRDPLLVELEGYREDERNERISPAERYREFKRATRPNNLFYSIPRPEWYKERVAREERERQAAERRRRNADMRKTRNDPALGTAALGDISIGCETNEEAFLKRHRKKNDYDLLPMLNVPRRESLDFQPASKGERDMMEANENERPYDPSEVVDPATYEIIAGMPLKEDARSLDGFNGGFRPPPLDWEEREAFNFRARRRSHQLDEWLDRTVKRALNHPVQVDTTGSRFTEGEVPDCGVKRPLQPKAEDLPEVGVIDYGPVYWGYCRTEAPKDTKSLELLKDAEVRGKLTSKAIVDAVTQQYSKLAKSRPKTHLVHRAQAAHPGQEDQVTLAVQEAQIIVRAQRLIIKGKKARGESTAVNVALLEKAEKDAAMLDAPRHTSVKKNTSTINGASPQHGATALTHAAANGAAAPFETIIKPEEDTTNVEDLQAQSGHKNAVEKEQSSLDSMRSSSELPVGGNVKEARSGKAISAKKPQKGTTKNSQVEKSTKALADNKHTAGLDHGSMNNQNSVKPRVPMQDITTKSQVKKGIAAPPEAVKPSKQALTTQNTPAKFGNGKKIKLGNLVAYDIAKEAAATNAESGIESQHEITPNVQSEVNPKSMPASKGKTEAVTENMSLPEQPTEPAEETVCDMKTELSNVNRSSSVPHFDTVVKHSREAPAEHFASSKMQGQPQMEAATAQQRDDVLLHPESANGKENSLSTSGSVFGPKAKGKQHRRAKTRPKKHGVQQAEAPTTASVSEVASLDHSQTRSEAHSHSQDLRTPMEVPTASATAADLPMRRLELETKERRSQPPGERQQNGNFAGTHQQNPYQKCAVTEGNWFAPKINVIIRPAREADLEQCKEIYDHYVHDTIYAIEKSSTTEDYWKEQLANAKERPFLVAVLQKLKGDVAREVAREVLATTQVGQNGKRKSRHGWNTNGQNINGHSMTDNQPPSFKKRRDLNLSREPIVGFAFSKAFGNHLTMFDNTAEALVYIHKDYTHQGIGKNLIDRLLCSHDPAYKSHCGTDLHLDHGNQVTQYTDGGANLMQTVISVFFEYGKMKEFEWKRALLCNWFDFHLSCMMLTVGYKLDKPVCMAQFMRESGARYDQKMSGSFPGRPTEIKDMIRPWWL